MSSRRLGFAAAEAQGPSWFTFPPGGCGTSETWNSFRMDLAGEEVQDPSWFLSLPGGLGTCETGGGGG